MQVGFHRHALRDGLRQAGEVAVQEFDALGVVHLAVQEEHVVVGQAVLGDPDRQAVALVDVHRPVVQRLRGDGPVGGGARAAHGLPHLPGVVVHRAGVVDVHADEVRRLHELPVGCGDAVGEGAHRGDGGGVVAPEDQVVQEDVEGHSPVGMAEVEGGLAGGLAALGGVVAGIAQPAAGHHAHGDVGAHGLDGPLGGAVGQGHVVQGAGHVGVAQLPAGGVQAVAVAQVGGALGLVEGHEAVHAAPEVLRHHAGVALKGGHDVPVEPAALVLQGAGEVPVIQRDQRADAVGAQLVHQLVVEFEAQGVDCAVAVRDDPGPAYREAVGPDVQRLHQRHVLPGAVVAVAGHVAGVAVLDVVAADLVAEVVPDAGTLAVGVPGALALEGGAGHAPQKVLRKLYHGFALRMCHCDIQHYSVSGRQLSTMSGKRKKDCIF